jgi:hypothetical protein
MSTNKSPCNGSPCSILNDLCITHPKSVTFVAKNLSSRANALGKKNETALCFPSGYASDQATSARTAVSYR